MNKMMDVTIWGKKECALLNASSLVPKFVTNEEKFGENVQNDIFRLENDYFVERIDSLRDTIKSARKGMDEKPEKYDEYLAKKVKAEKALEETKQEFEDFKLALMEYHEVEKEEDLPYFVHGDRVSTAYVLALGLARSAKIKFDGFENTARGMLNHARQFCDLTEWTDARKADCVRLKDNMTDYMKDLVSGEGDDYDVNRMIITGKDFTMTFSACIPYIKAGCTKEGLFGTIESQKNTGVVFMAMFRAVLHRNGVDLPKTDNSKRKPRVSANF